MALETGPLTAWRLRWYPRILAGALALSFALAVTTAQGSTALTGRLGGDLPAFVGAAHLVLDGRAGELYDWRAQAESQAGLHGQDRGDFLAYAYPPFVAAAYVPLAVLPWRVAVLAHAIAMAGALYAAILLLGGALARVASDPGRAFCAALTFLPMFQSVTGGQNTALTVLLVAGAWRAAVGGRDLACGLCAGLVLFKPQFALPLLGLLLVARRWRALLGFAVSGVGLYLAGAAVAGWGWPATWWAGIAGFQATDQAVNAPNSVGLLGFCEALLGPGTPAAIGLGGALTLGATLGLAALWACGARVPARVRWGLAVAGIVLIPPHSMYYDAGLVVLVLAAVAERGRSALPWLVVAWAAALLSPLARMLGFNPMFFVVVAATAWLAAEVGRRNVPHAGTGAAVPGPADAG